MNYIVYKTTNKVNGKIYIGVHKTTNINDGYLGSGVFLKQAIEKYGRENFDREILHNCDTYEEVLQIESDIVDEKFVSRNDTYNIALGGGFGNLGESINLKISQRRREAHADPIKKMNHVAGCLAAQTEELRKVRSNGARKQHEMGLGNVESGLLVMNSKHTCSVCGKTMNLGNFKKYGHGDDCKQKERSPKAPF